MPPTLLRRNIPSGPRMIVLLTVQRTPGLTALAITNRTGLRSAAVNAALLGMVTLGWLTATQVRDYRYYRLHYRTTLLGDRVARICHDVLAVTASALVGHDIRT